MLIQSGQIDEIIYARLSPGDDLLARLWEVCRIKDVKTGFLLDATGAMTRLRIERWPRAVRPPTGGRALPTDLIDFVEMPGPFEVSGHGIIGEGWEPDAPANAPSREFAGFEQHGGPYVHVHLVASNSESTVCGHLLEGSIIHGPPGGTSPGGFTLVIAKVTGVRLRAVYAETSKGFTFHHELEPLPR